MQDHKQLMVKHLEVNLLMLLIHPTTPQRMIAAWPDGLNLNNDKRKRKETRTKSKLVSVRLRLSV